MTVIGILAVGAAVALYAVPRLFPSERPEASGSAFDPAAFLAARAAAIPGGTRLPVPAEDREITQVLASVTEENADESVGRLRRLLAEREDSAARRAALAWALFIVGKPEDGRKELDRAMETDPDCPLAHAASAYAHLRHRRFAEAEKDMRRAVALCPAVPEWRRLHSMALLATGKIEDALAAAETAAALAPRSPVYYLAVGDVHLRQGRLVDALRWYETACRIAGPDSEIAREHGAFVEAIRARSAL
jgi:tetratricopeptide (TPR) repeat protein